MIPNTNRSLVFACDSNLGLVMMAPVPGRDNIGSDRGVALIVEMPAAKPEIVTGVSEIYEDGLDARVPISRTGPILRTIINERPIRILRLNLGYVVPPQGAGGAVSRFARTCRKAPTKMMVAPAGSYWMHSGSIMRLEASKTRRKFVVYKPSEAMSTLSAKPGSVRFEGHIYNNRYSGRAFLFTEKCGQIPYQVTGKIENHDERVILTGKAPRLDNNCHQIGRRDMTLTFDFMKEPIQ